MTEIFFTGMISTIGAFIPVFILMYFHYRIRKSSYYDKKQMLIKLRDGYNQLAEINDVYINTVYKELGAKDYKDFLAKSNNLALINSVNRELDTKTKNLDTANELILDISYIEDYNLKTYLGTLLDRRFPDKHFK